MQFLKKHHLAILYVVIALFLAFFGFRLFGDSVKVGDVIFFAFFSAALLILPAVEQGEKILKKLAELVPKDLPVTGSVNAIEPRHQRRDLEHSLVHAIAPSLALQMNGKGVGDYIRAAADAILNDGLPIPKLACTCGPNQCCNSCPVHDDLSFAAMVRGGAEADQRAEAEIVAKGLTATRVTADQIQTLMDRLTWRYEHEAGSRHTFAHAFLDDFYIATGHNAPISRENFDAALGQKYAREQAEGKAREKLWELEGYKLLSQLKGEEA